jgi:hypothetical protein
MFTGREQEEQVTFNKNSFERKHFKTPLLFYFSLSRARACVRMLLEVTCSSCSRPVFKHLLPVPLSVPYLFLYLFPRSFFNCFFGPLTS